MSAFCIFHNVEVTDPQALADYAERSRHLVGRFGGRYRILLGKAEVVEGNWTPDPTVMIEFPTMADARRWYGSDEYRELKAIREAAGRFRAVFIEGA